MTAWKVTAVILSILTLNKSESGITCPKGPGDIRDQQNYCHDLGATECQAVTELQLVLNCTPCQSAATVEWTYNDNPLNATSPQLTLPPDKVVASASGCYRCSCLESNDAAFAVQIKSAEKPFLLVPNDIIDGLTYLLPQTQMIDLNRTSSGNITVNCTAGGWPTPNVNWSSGPMTPFGDPCQFIWDDGFVLQKVIPRDPITLPSSTCYYCTLYNLAGTLTATQTIEYDDVREYFMKPAQDLVAQVEVGSEGYCAVYAESGNEIIYTVCLVPSNDTEVCPLIVQNTTNCCVCGEPDCDWALGEGVNTSCGCAPAHAVYPGVGACIILSQLAVTFDCFVQRSSGVGISLRQHTGNISFYAPISPAPAHEVIMDRTLTISLSVPLAVCVLIICVLSVSLLYMCRKKRVNKSAGQSNVEVEGGPGDANEVGGPADAGCVKNKPVDLKVASNFIPRMACKWDMIGLQLHQDDLVQTLNQPNLNSISNCTQILQAAKESTEGLAYGRLSTVLSSEAVGLTLVATDLLQDAVAFEREKEHVEPPTNGDQRSPGSSSATTPADVPDTTGLLTEGTVA